MRAQLVVGVGLASILAASTVRAAESGDPSQSPPHVELVKKKKSSGGGGGGERGWMDYLKDSFTFADVDVVDAVKEGALAEHLLGGLFSEVGGHLWAPKFTYKDAPEEVPGAKILGIISLVTALIPFGFFFFAFVPFIGWYLFYFWWALAFFTGVLSAIFNFWFLPRALQFAYSDAYRAAGRGGSSKKKRSRSDDDDDE